MLPDETVQPTTCSIFPNDEPSGPSKTMVHLVLASLIGLFVFRLAYAIFAPFDLVHDEAYYWEWSRRLDFGYFSKPPMVAWLIAASTSVFGDTAWAVRLPAVFLGTLGLLFVYLLARRMYGENTALWAVALAAATPGNAAGALIMTIDAPLLFFWSAALYTLWRALERQTDRPWWLLATAVAVGLGLLTKQTMCGFVALAIAFTLFSKPDRREWRSLGFWSWIGGASLFLLPVLVWNAQHDWIMLQHTREHFTSTKVDIVRRILVSLEFLGSQVGAASPVTFFGVMATFAAAAWMFPRLERRERFLLCFSALPLAGVFALSLTQRVEPNWPAPFYVAGVILFASATRGLLAWRPRGFATEVWRRRALATGIAFSLGAYLLPWSIEALGWQGTGWDPLIRLRRWSDVGQDIASAMPPILEAEQSLMLVVGNRAVASELAFYKPDSRPVHLWSAQAEPASQYDIWGLPTLEAGADAVVITEANRDVPPELAACFQSWTAWRTSQLPIGQDMRHSYQLWLARDFVGWPDMNGHRLANQPPPRGVSVL